MRLLLIVALPFIVGFELPRGTKVDTISEKFVQSGLRMEVYYYQHVDLPQDFTTDVLDILENESGEVIARQLDEKTLSIGLLTDKKFVSVTIQSDRNGGTEGFLTKTDPTIRKIPDPPLKLPYSMRMLSYTEDKIGGIEKQTWVFHSKRDPVWVRNQIKQHNLDEVYKSVNGSVLYQGVIGTSRLQVTASALEDGTGLVIVK